MSKLVQACEPYQTDLKDYCAAALKEQAWGETEVYRHSLNSLTDLATLPQLTPFSEANVAPTLLKKQIVLVC